MQKASLYFVFYLMFANCGLAQMLDARKVLFSDMPFFREEFIQRNKIKAFYGKVSTKKELDIIRSKGELQYFEFNSNGFLTMQYRVFPIGNTLKDTLFVMYNYDEKNRVQELKKTDANGFYSYLYTFDEKGNIIEQTYSRYENEGSSRKNFVAGKRYEISSEKFTFEQLTPTQAKKKYYNTYGNIYREDIINTDVNGLLVSVDAMYIVGNTRYSYTYTYNQKALLASFTEEVIADNTNNIETKYTYDDTGNLLEENVFRNGKHITVKQYLLDEKTMLVKATLVKDVSTNLITIFEYKYEFY
jgi:YD repeat-containing protein